MTELEDLSQKLEEYHDNLRDMESSLQKSEDRFRGHNMQGTSAKDPKHADKIKVRFTLL